MEGLPSYFWAALILYGTLVSGSWALSSMGTLLVRNCREVIGSRLTILLFESPSILLHELSHLVVAIVFGHRVTGFNIKGVFVPGAGGHVTTTYNPRSFYQRMGLSMMAIAPVLIPMSVLCAAMISTYGMPQPGEQREWIESVLWSRPEPQSAAWIAGALYLHLLISATMRLSNQDWKEFARGAGTTVLLLTVTAALFYRGDTPWMWSPTLVIGGGFLLAFASKAFLLVIVMSARNLRQMV